MSLFYHQSLPRFHTVLLCICIYKSVPLVFNARKLISSQMAPKAWQIESFSWRSLMLPLEQIHLRLTRIHTKCYVERGVKLGKCKWSNTTYMQILAHPADMHATIALLPKPFHTFMYEVTSYFNIVPVQYIHCMVFSHFPWMAVWMLTLLSRV